MNNPISLINYSALPLEDLIRVGRGLAQGRVLDTTEAALEASGFFVTEYESLPPSLIGSSVSNTAQTSEFVGICDCTAQYRSLREAALSAERFPGNSDLRHSFIYLLLSSVSRYLSHNGETSFLGVQRSDPGLLGTTINKRDKRFIGLHVDSWTRLDVQDRADAQNRICINLGEEARIFLFLPLPIGDIQSRMKHDQRRPTSLTRLFLELNPAVTVIACVIPPGFAYIAPTESIAHDASTVNMTKEDVTATLLGTFMPLPSSGTLACVLPVMPALTGC